MSGKILITGARSAVAIDMARDFRNQGYEVHMADCSSAYIARWSRIPKCVHRYASPAKETLQFFADIRRIAEHLNPEMIIPTCEEVFYLPQAFARTAMGDRVFAPSGDDLDRLHNKYSFAKFCDKLGLDVPETYQLEQLQDLQNYRSTSEAWVFKPCYSRFGAETLITPTPQELEKLSFDKKAAWVAQKFIRGRELSFYAISKSGVLSALAVYTSSWRLGGGASYAFEPVSYEVFEQVREIAGRLAGGLNLTSQFSCDLMQDETGKVWLIECNPRATSGLHLLSGKLATAIAGGDKIPKATQSVTKYMLPMMISHGFIRALKSNRLKLWVETVRSGKDVIGGKNDRLPVFGAIVDTILFKMEGLKKGVSLAQATTADIEWNGKALK